MSAELFAGKIVYLKMPYGDLFTRPRSKVRCVFIAGGTGIVPFLSLFTSPSFNEYVCPKLYFGVRNKSYNIYHGDIEKALKINPEFKIKTRYEDHEGLLDIDVIRAENGIDSTYFLSGPPMMINTFRQKLREYLVNENNIISDEWE